jgi:hypothetical protein
MPRLFDRIASADGILARSAGWTMTRVLPAITAQGAGCFWRCTGVPCDIDGSAARTWECLTSAGGEACIQICRCTTRCSGG